MRSMISYEEKVSQKTESIENEESIDHVRCPDHRINVKAYIHRHEKFHLSQYQNEC